MFSGILALCKRFSQMLWRSLLQGIDILRPDKLMISCGDVRVNILWFILWTIFTRTIIAKVLIIVGLSSVLMEMPTGIGLPIHNIAGDGILTSTLTEPISAEPETVDLLEPLLLRRLGSIIGGGNKGSKGKNWSSRFTSMLEYKPHGRKTLTHSWYLISALPLLSFDRKLKDGGKVVWRWVMITFVFWHIEKTGNLSWKGNIVVPFGKVKALQFTGAEECGKMVWEVLKNCWSIL